MAFRLTQKRRKAKPITGIKKALTMLFLVKNKHTPCCHYCFFLVSRQAHALRTVVSITLFLSLRKQSQISDIKDTALYASNVNSCKRKETVVGFSNVGKLHGRLALPPIAHSSSSPRLGHDSPLRKKARLNLFRFGRALRFFLRRLSRASDKRDAEEMYGTSGGVETNTLLIYLGVSVARSDVVRTFKRIYSKRIASHALIFLY